MGKRVVFLVLAVTLVMECGHCLAQGFQFNKQSSRKLTSLTDFNSFAGSGVSYMKQKEYLDSRTDTLSVSADDSIKVAAGGTKKLTKADFLQKIWNYEVSPQQWVFLGEKPALIDFYADWCGPCKIAAPIMEEVSGEFAGQVDFYKIDTQREQELAAVFGVRSIPAFLYIPKNGKPAMSMGIARSKEETKQMFIDNINKLLIQGE